MERARAVAATPKVVRVALGINVVLLFAALMFPRMMAGQGQGLDAAAGAALLFVIPMALIFAVGMAAATRAYLLARREDKRMKWTALLPLLLFLVGVLTTLALVYLETSGTNSVN